MTAAPDRWTEHEMVELAARGIGKVDHLGIRGITLCSADEIAAMAAVLVFCGLPAIPPGEGVPATFYPLKLNHFTGVDDD